MSETEEGREVLGMVVYRSVWNMREKNDGLGGSKGRGEGREKREGGREGGTLGAREGVEGERQHNSPSFNLLSHMSVWQSSFTCMK